MSENSEKTSSSDTVKSSHSGGGAPNTPTPSRPSSGDTTNRPSSGGPSSGDNTGYRKTGSGDSQSRGRNDRPYKNRGGFKRSPFFKAKKECYFSKNHIDFIDYKNVDFLKRFLGKNGRILPRRITGTKMIHQRMLANAVKRSRFMGLLPFVGSIWSKDYYEQQSREYMEKKRQSQMREEVNNAPEPVATEQSSQSEEVSSKG